MCTPPNRDPALERRKQLMLKREIRSRWGPLHLQEPREGPGGSTLDDVYRYPRSYPRQRQEPGRGQDRYPITARAGPALRPVLGAWAGAAQRQVALLTSAPKGPPTSFEDTW
jgi:hypothetical protein